MSCSQWQLSPSEPCSKHFIPSRLHPSGNIQFTRWSFSRQCVCHLVELAIMAGCSESRKYADVCKGGECVLESLKYSCWFSSESRSSIASVASSYKSLPDPDFVLKPDSFDVVLCVDMQEKAWVAILSLFQFVWLPNLWWQWIIYKGFPSRSKMAQLVLQPELKKNGIQYQLRKLQVGDFLWIARPKFGGNTHFCFHFDDHGKWDIIFMLRKAHAHEPRV